MFLIDKKTLTVSELTSQIKELLEDKFFDIYVVGEISNLSMPISGHIYFTLKDEYSAIKCVLFKFQKRLIDFQFKDGDKVIVRGRINVYEKRGEYQIIVDYMELAGIGSLYQKFEMLKRKLEKEGLFDKKFKKKIPEFPKKIVVITSPTGAAIRDILNILKRRFFNINVIIAPVKVQGEEAKFEIVKAIELVNLYIEDADVIILARGGGSLEDLQPFNEEIVARAIFKSKIPIISAVGHETDFTIADFTADLRAPTPSAAAELVVKNKEDVLIHLSNLERQLITSMNRILNEKKHKVTYLENKLFSFSSEIKNLKNKIKEYENHINVLLFQLITSKRKKFLTLREKLNSNSPLVEIEKNKNKINQLSKKLSSIIETYLSNCKNKLVNIETSLKNLNPLNVLSRGYSIVFKDSHVVTSTKQVHIGDNLKILLKKGELFAKVNKKLDIF